MLNTNLTKEKILNAAEKRMIQFGYRKVTMDEIAQDLHMSKNTIYKEFVGKEEIAKALVKRQQQKLNIALDNIEKTQNDPLRVFSDSVLLLRKQLGPWFEHFFKEIPAELPSLWEEFLHYRNEKILDIRSLVEKGSRNGIFRPVNPSIATEAYLGAVKAIMNPRFLEQENLTFEQALDAVLDIWSNGIWINRKSTKSGGHMKKVVLILIAIMTFVWAGSPSFAATSSVDALIQKLEDKGILTGQDANQIKGEIASDEKTSQETTFKSLLPDWLNNIKLTGDFRIRDQYQRIKVASTKGGIGPNAGYNRVRVRARLNFEDQINDKVKVVFGIATDGENAAGAGNPRSNNLTLGGNSDPSENSFNKQSVVVQKAFVTYKPASYITLMGGKMDNPIWEPMSPSNASLLWDPNITPEGGAIQLQKKINDYITPFTTNAMFILADAQASTSTTAFKTDPYIFVTQNGIKGNLTEKVYYKTAFTYYGVENPNHVVFGNRPSSSSNPTNNTNSTNSTGTNYLYGYSLVGGSVDLGMNDPFGELLPSPIYIPQVGVLGQYYKNLDPSKNNAAWEMGGYMGSSALNGWGTWKLQTVYKVLERDSWLDTLPDADDYNGATDTYGWRSELDLGLAKNVWFTFSYYRVNVYKYFATLSQGSTAFSQSAPENLYQMDFNFRF